jgi:hypothetical protein
MFVEFRLGEAYYFLGTMDNDVKSLTLARSAWGRSTRAFGTADSLELLTVARPIFGDVSRLGRHHPESARAAAELALSELERPHVHTSAAWRGYLLARDLLGQPDPPNYHPVLGPREDIRLLDSCIVWNGLGESLMRDGEVLGDADLLTEAITVFHECELLWTRRDDREPFASFRYNFGTAYRIRAALASSPADLDSSRTQIRLAMALTSAAERPDLHADYRSELARIATVGASLTNDAGETRANLEEAVGELTRARLLVDTANAPVPVARIDVQSVDVLVRLAEIDPSRELDAADSLLTVSGPPLASSLRPLLHARWHLTRTRLLRTRWQRTNDPALRTQALDALSHARELTTESDSPAFFRETQREEDLLGG